MGLNRTEKDRLPQWLWWLVGAVTVMAAALLILAVVLGIRAGQQQLAIQSRQQVGIHLQRAIDLRAGGDLEGALAEYQQVLMLDPTNAGAVQGIENLFELASSPSSVRPIQPAPAVNAPAEPTAVSQANPSPIADSPLPTEPPATAAPTSDPAAALWEEARAQYAAGDWLAAVETLEALEKANPDYRRTQAGDLLFNAFVNLSAESDNAGRIQEALNYVDEALALRPDNAQLRQARTMASTYLDVLSVLGADWSRAINLLEELYTENPSYRDVEERLYGAYVSYGDQLAEEEEHCDAIDYYLAALDMDAAPELFSKRDDAQRNCGENGGTIVQGSPTRSTSTTVATATSISPSATSSAASVEVDAAPTEEPIPVVAVGTPPGGRILYAASNPDDRRSRIFVQPISGGAPSVLVEDGTQPSLRADGTRVVFYNTRDDMAGLSSLDPDTGLLLRFTRFAEDSRPSWSPDGNQIVFASNREGDRRWRIYVGWAETDGEVVSRAFGDSAAWHPTTDLIAFHGCDDTGNGCGLWRMNSGGGNRSTLTSNPADITPAWSSDGGTVVFTSNDRHGNYEVYAVDTNSKTVTRLTEHPANDGVPTVSPDGTWVAFLSDRGGIWQIWGVPISGGEAVVLGEIDGNIGNWLEQQIQWIN